MRKLFTVSFVAIVATLSTIYSCQKENENTKAEKLEAQQCLQDSKGASNTSSTSPYNVYLYAITPNNDGTYTWEWRVRNLTPGNGKPGTGTVQDLSHWGITLGDCITPDNIISAATSTNGTSWSSFTPEFKTDPSQDCFTAKVIKFNLGTTGSNISYYRLTIDKNVSHTTRTGYYKSGKNTGCGLLETCGFGCD